MQELDDNLRDLLVHLASHWRLIVGLSAATLAGAVLFAWSGVYSVAATSGHYPFFRLFLSFALDKSVAAHTVGIRIPAEVLEDPGAVRRGAGHYQGGCAPCHGAPGEARNPIARRMLPEPPYLGDRIRDWSPEELFWIVRHGIKYAGMPSWVAPERDDEVWAVVAFLRHLPQMEPAAYRRLAFGEIGSATEGVAEGVSLLLMNGPAGNGIAACGRCHGADGLGGESGAFPRLVGQSEAYLRAALQAYALGTRPSGIMQPVAAELAAEEINALAAHYAVQPVPSDSGDGPETATLSLGRRIAEEGRPDRGVAACTACHGGTSRHPLIPRLEGQHAGFVSSQLELWMRGVRGGGSGDVFARIMAYGVGIDPRRPPAKESHWPLSPAEIRAVAAWYATQPLPADAVARR
ncbi:MAG: c-type cytochrome [Geminicoccaceae bacterium]